jgi:hypothetical protein
LTANLITAATVTRATVTRRSVLLGGVLVGVVPLLSACGAATQPPQPVAGDDNQPGEPLWSAATNAFLIGLDEARLTELRQWHPVQLTMSAEKIFAVENQCTVDTDRKTTLVWCRGSQAFGCGVCGSVWSTIGRPLAVATTGLTALQVTVDAAGNVTVDRQRRSPGRTVTADQTLPGDNPGCGQPTFSVSTS